MASDLPVAVRIHQYLRTLSSHLKERAAAMLLAEARDEIEISEWIPVTERLPPEETRVLATDGTSVFESEYMHGRWEWLADVTHWLPMPNPPKVK
jgi:hypothetical protein